MNFLDGYVRSPFAGLAPWLLMAVVAGPGRFLPEEPKTTVPQ